MSLKSLFSKKSKAAVFFIVFLILLFTFAIFFLDIFTGEKIPFHIFYFPSIMLVTWLFGKKAGGSMVGLTATMWFFAEWDTGHFKTTSIFLCNGLIYIGTFIVIFVMTNLVHEKKLQLETKSKELARSNLELEQFAFKAAHDLQSPLVTILGFTELLQEKCSKLGDAETNTFLQHILKGIERMSAFTKALLEYSKISKPEKEVSEVDLNIVLADVMTSLQITIQDKKAQIAIGPLPKVRVNASLAGLLFQNLIINAIKYCEKEPRINIQVVKREKNWVFSVQDNGIGIPEEAREKIFIMFEKLPTQRDYPGFGIGLATCQKIVERYGGRMWVESMLGSGSTFYFTLPIP